MTGLLDVAWVLFEDPDPDTIVHRVDLRRGRLVCVDWVTHNAGKRVSDKEIAKYGPRCEICWAPSEGES